MKKYQIRLLGPETRGARISGFVLRDLLHVLTEGSLRSLRLKVEGRSLAKGPVPPWLKASARFDVVGLADGSTVLMLEAPTLIEAAPERFAQKDLFQDVDVEIPSLALMEQGLQDALAGNSESDAYDDDLIEVFEDFSRLLGSGIRSIRIQGDRVLDVTQDGMGRIGQLRRQTPPPRRIRVAGKIDAIRHSDRMFTLILESETTIRGIAETIPANHLAELFGKSAIVSGRAVFRPSGSLLRIEAEHVDLAEGDVSIWSSIPQPLEGEVDLRKLRQVQGPRSGLNVIFAEWPGDESDDEIRARLAELS